MIEKFAAVAKDLLAAKQAYGGLSDEKYRKMKEGVDSTAGYAQGAANVVKQDSPFNAAGEVLGGAGDKLMETGNPYAMAAGVVLKFAGAVAESVEKIRGWATELHNANMAFADFSSAMNQVQADTEMRDFERKSQQGDNRAETAEQLAKALGDLNDTMAPFEDVWADFKNEVATVLVEAATAVIRWLPEIGKGKPKEDEMRGVVYGADAYQAAVERSAKSRRPKRLGGGS